LEDIGAQLFRYRKLTKRERIIAGKVSPLKSAPAIVASDVDPLGMAKKGGVLADV